MSATTRQNVSLRRERLLGDEPGAFAIARYVRTSPLKVRKVADLIRGVGADDALTMLKFQPQAVAETLYKLIDSAVANAEDTEGLDRGDLVITQIMVDEGPIMKRVRPRAKGAADRILKRSSHITAVVQPRTSQKGGKR